MEAFEETAHPRLRAVEAFPVRIEGEQLLCLRDTQGFAERPIFLNRYLTLIVSMMDGTNSLQDIQVHFARETGEILFMEDLQNLVQQLNQFRYLDNASFQEFYNSQVEEFRKSSRRPARHAGSAYEAAPEGLRRQIDGYFDHPQGPGTISSTVRGAPLRGLIAPHIDFHRGGPTYGHAYKALAENTGPDRFIIFGTCHNLMQQRFALTAKDYDTPLGCTRTDEDFVRRLAGRLRRDYFLDEFLHQNEHSIEFQAVWLKYVLGETDFKIIPILVGSFHDIYRDGKSAAEDVEVQAMVEGIKRTVEEVPGTYCLIAAADLAHVGRRFGDRSGPTEESLQDVEADDRRFLELAMAGDAEEVFRSIAADADRRRVCGYPPIYMTLRCLDLTAAKLLQYRQWADLESGAAVTYAAVAFH